MIIESLDARNGDATLVLHPGASGKLVGLVDGGPTGVFKATINEALASHGITAEQGQLAWVAVSHVDADHIGGIIKLVAAGIPFGKFLFNTPAAFPNVKVVVASTSAHPEAGDLEQTVAASIAGLPAGVGIASIPQGQRLLNMILENSERASTLNDPLGRRLLTKDIIEIDGLKLTVIGPSAARLDRLFAMWASSPATASAKEVDTSVSNLSSLTFLIEADGQVALFTGDGLEDDIVQGLKDVGKSFPLDIDLLKLPHHGSNSAARQESLDAGLGLIENVRAKHYIVSADGTSTNPSPDTLKRITALGRPCTVWFPAPTSSGTSEAELYYKSTVDDFIAHNEAVHAPIVVNIGTGTPLVIDLGD